MHNEWLDHDEDTIGFQWHYCEEHRSYMRELIQEKLMGSMKQIHQIAQDISETVKEDGSVPFIAFAGTPGAGKSFLCKNLQ